MIGQLASIIENAMNPTCAANVISLFCRTAFKECKQTVDPSTGSERLLPSLLCRSECERHWETWNTCLANLEKDPDAKGNFGKQMQDLVRQLVLIIERSLYAPTSECFLSFDRQADLLDLGATVFSGTGLHFENDVHIVPSLALIIWFHLSRTPHSPSERTRQLAFSVSTSGM